MKICIPIKVKTQKEALKMLKKVVGKADMAEIWLDHIKDLDIPALLKNKSLPVICVCKRPEDKGLFKGSYAQMAEILMEAVKYGAEYVDIPLQGLRTKSEVNSDSDLTSEDYGLSKLLNKKVVQRVCHPVLRGGSGSIKLSCKQSGSRIKSGMTRGKAILSYHNFLKTPSIKTLHKMARDMKKAGADIVKIAVMAKTLDDTFSIISLAQILKEEGIAHILIAMGKKGILSRVLTPLLGGTIMFAPLVKKDASASGQLTVKELQEVWRMFE